MAHTVLRFVHAGPLQLDAPLSGTLGLSADQRRLVEDATLIAWERIVDACLERSADFLLLTGTALDQPATLRARRAFTEGCAALGEFDIAVLVDDPQLTPETFADFPLPDNVRILERLTAATWTRPQRLSVWIVPLRPEAKPLSAFAVGSDGGPDAFTIAIAGESHAGVPLPQFDYAALNLEAPHHSTATTGCVLHSPSAAQGLCGDRAGPRGCSVVEVDADRRVEVSALPTAAVRWEQFALHLNESTGRDQLVEEMQWALLDREASVGERLWIVKWRMQGAGAVFESLTDDLAFRGLCDAVESGLGGKAGPERVHRRELIEEPDRDDDSLIREYVGALSDADCEQDFAELRRIAQNRQSARVCVVDDSAVRAAAARLGRLWLTGREDRRPTG
jgi:hypothetical protein